MSGMTGLGSNAGGMKEIKASHKGGVSSKGSLKGCGIRMKPEGNSPITKAPAVKAGGTTVSMAPASQGGFSNMGKKPSGGGISVSMKGSGKGVQKQTVKQAAVTVKAPKLSKM